MKLVTLFDLNWVMPPTLESFICSIIYGVGVRKEAKPLWQVAIFAGSWYIWLLRKRRIFHDPANSFEDIWDGTILMAILWAKAHGHFLYSCIAAFHGNWESSFHSAHDAAIV